MAEHDVKLKDFTNIFSLEGKVAVVTGGSRGLGLHIASGLLQSGASKVIISSRKAAACAEAAKHLNALPCKGTAIPIAADVSKASEIDRLVAEVSKHSDHVDILIANAGATWGAKFTEHTDASFTKVMDLNVKSVFFLVQKFLPLLTKRASADQPSKVVATASVAGIGIGSVGDNGTPSYSASKAAVIHLTRNMAVELGPRHVLCNAIAPGFFPSKMANGLIEIGGGLEKLARESPNGRLGRAEDVAGTVVYLCSRAADHVNGGLVALDGGKVWGAARL